MGVLADNSVSCVRRRLGATTRPLPEEVGLAPLDAHQRKGTCSGSSRQPWSPSPTAIPIGCAQQTRRRATCRNPDLVETN